MSVGMSISSPRSDVRDYHERLVLYYIRCLGESSKPELSRLTGLSPQAVSVIVGSLERDEFLVRGSPRRGRVGQPSIPFRLNPDSVFSVGLRVGLRRSDLVLIDFLGVIRHLRFITYRRPSRDLIIDFASRGIDRLTSHYSPDRILGIGITLPSSLRSHPDSDISSALSSRTGFACHIYDDSLSACCGELSFGAGAKHPDFAYFFIGGAVTGGIILGSHPYPSSFGFLTAGSPLVRLTDCASLTSLDRLTQFSDLSWRDSDDWSSHSEIIDSWLSSSGFCLAESLVTVCLVTGISTVVIDGNFPTSIRDRLVSRVGSALAALDIDDSIRPLVMSGTLGRYARVIGGGCHLLRSRFFPVMNVSRTFLD